MVTGLALGAFSIVTDDPRGVEGVLLTLLIPTCAYALLGLLGRADWSWRVVGGVVVLLFAVEAVGLPGPASLVALTVAAVVVGAVLGRWRPPPTVLAWQPWAAAAFLAAVVASLAVDVTAAKLLLAVGLLAHGTWDVVLWRRRAVVARSLAEWCAALDISLGLGLLVLVLAT